VEVEMSKGLLREKDDDGVVVVGRQKNWWWELPLAVWVKVLYRLGYRDEV
jgi:hypothetical protein